MKRVEAGGRFSGRPHALPEVLYRQPELSYHGMIEAEALQGLRPPAEMPPRYADDLVHGWATEVALLTGAWGAPRFWVYGF